MFYSWANWARVKVAEKFQVEGNYALGISWLVYCLWQRIQHVPIFLTALANVLENTALFGDILLRLPDITHEVKQKIRLYIFKVLKALYISLNFRLSKRCVPSNLILLKRKSSISAIDISSRMSVNNILFIHIPQLFLSQIDIIFTYPVCPLTHLKEKVFLKARVYLWLYCAHGLF